VKRTHADAFLDTILKDPDDDTPRLVYADWLEEHGGPAGAARAEFIRVQCRLAAGRLPVAVRQELEARQRQLLRGQGEDWGGDVRGLVFQLLWHRGFVAEVWMSATRFLADADKLFRRAPVQHLHVYSLSGAQPARGRLVPALAGSAHLARLISLDLSHLGLTSDELSALLVSEHLGRLESLVLHHNRVGDGGLRALASSAVLGRLHALDLRDNAFGPPGLRALGAAVERLAAGEGLRLRQVYLGDLLRQPSWGRVLAPFPALRRVARRGSMSRAGFLGRPVG
jgi:uncharacterized protein (TIGR02996 family)